MKKQLITLVITALIAGGCGGRAVRENRPQIQANLSFQSDTLLVNGLQLVKTTDENSRIYCLTTINGDTIIPFADYYHQIKFLDINEDGFTDIRVFIFSDTPNECYNYLFDSQNKTFREIYNYLPIQKVSGTDFYYSYEAEGCADMNWISLLSKIKDDRLVHYGIIRGYGCEGQKFIIIKKIVDTKEIEIKSLPYTENLDKWDFIKNYWKANHKIFEK